MITECNYRDARQCFARRELVNWIAAIGGALGLFAIGMLFVSPIVAGLVCVGLGYFALFHVLDKRGFRFACPHCTKYIETKTPWKCGYKNCHNYNVVNFPFIGSCEICGAEPKAYKCHHADCRELIFFTKDEQNFNYAECINLPALPKPPAQKATIDSHAATLETARKSIERKSLEVEEVKVDLELKSLRQSLEGPRMKSVEELYRAALKNEDDERRVRAAIDAEFKDNKEERERRHLAVDKIMKEVV